MTVTFIQRIAVWRHWIVNRVHSPFCLLRARRSYDIRHRVSSPSVQGECHVADSLALEQTLCTKGEWNQVTAQPVWHSERSAISFQYNFLTFPAKFELSEKITCFISCQTLGCGSVHFSVRDGDLILVLECLTQKQRKLYKPECRICKICWKHKRPLSNKICKRIL